MAKRKTIATLSRDRIMAHRDNLEKKLTESDKACAIWAVCELYLSEK